MSYSTITFLWRKPGLTPDEFRQHYETNHIPLLLNLLGPAFPKSHTRFYITRQLSSTNSPDASNADYTPTIFIGNTHDFDYDAFASLVFKDATAFEAFYARLTDPDVAKVVAEDEEKFLWRQKFIAAATGTPCVTLQPEAA